MEHKEINLNGISETLLFPLYCRAIESNSKNPILKDIKAEEIVNQLNIIFQNSDRGLFKILSNNEIQKKNLVMIALRSKKIDENVKNFYLKNQDCVIVNLGCGLDTRFTRIDNGKIQWYDLDLPEVIKIRKKFFSETERYHFISSSILNFDWIKTLTKEKHRSFLFIAEGVFMYLPENKVKQLILKIQSNFPGCEIVCQLANIHVIKKFKEEYWRQKFQKQFNLGKNVTFQWGVNDGHHLEKWNEGIMLLEEWMYLDEKNKKIGFIRHFRQLKFFRKGNIVSHYLLK